MRAAHFALLLTLPLTGCNNNTPTDASTRPPAELRVGPENIVKAVQDEIVTGPLLSGELHADREATMRAEVGGPMAVVAVREGEAVKRGAVLGRIAARQLSDAQRSAETAVRAAETQLEIARGEAERTESLVTAGALAKRDFELAQSNVTAIEAQLADARARLAASTTQLGDTTIRAPFDGVVADRAVNVGDVVTVGTPLFTIIDPSSMRLEASVPSRALGEIRVGARVAFSVRGYEDTFTGRVDRISPRADPVTRQIPIFVSIPNTENRPVAGLYAEGRVVADSAQGVVVPTNAVNMQHASPWVLRARDGKAERVTVTLGLRDDRTERVLITDGIAEGDVLLRGAAQGIAPGTPIRLPAPDPALPVAPPTSN